VKASLQEEPPLFADNKIRVNNAAATVEQIQQKNPLRSATLAARKFTCK